MRCDWERRNDAASISPASRRLGAGGTRRPRALRRVPVGLFARTAGPGCRLGSIPRRLSQAGQAAAQRALLRLSRRSEAGSRAAARHRRADASRRRFWLRRRQSGSCEEPDPRTGLDRRRRTAHAARTRRRTADCSADRGAARLDYHRRHWTGGRTARSRSPRPLGVSSGCPSPRPAGPSHRLGQKPHRSLRRAPSTSRSASRPRPKPPG